MSDICIAVTDGEITATYLVMRQLRTHVTEAEYVSLVRKQEEHGYRLAFLRDGEHIVAVAGFKLSSSLAWGKFVYVDDLVCDEVSRSDGHGSSLLSWIGEYGRQHGCNQLHLDSGVQRYAAHRFYLREKMDITCHHFCRGLT